MGDIFLGTRKIPPWKVAPLRIAPQHITPLEDFPRKIPNHVNSPLKIPTHSDSSGRLPPPPPPPRIIPNYIYLDSTLKNPTNENPPPTKKKRIARLYTNWPQKIPRKASLMHAVSFKQNHCFSPICHGGGSCKCSITEKFSGNFFQFLVTREKFF